MRQSADTVSRAVHRAYIFFVFLALTALFPSGADAQPRQHRTAHVRAAASDRRMLATQIALDRAGFSPGEIDGQGGAKTSLALAAFRAASTVPLDLPAEPLTNYTISEHDVAGPFLDSVPQDLMEQAALPALSYTSPLEAIAEKFHSSPVLLRRLNPEASWKAGDSINVPDVEPFELPHAPNRSAGPAVPVPKQAAGQLEIVVDGETKSLTVRDAGGRTVMYAPVTTGSEHDPLPIGEWKVVGVSWNPVFNYNPDLFWDADASQARAKIPPGPNNPVGVVWIDLNKPHFGLHGTPEPATIGRVESHGCIRLTNWDATKLGRLARPGTKVIFK